MPAFLVQAIGLIPTLFSAGQDLAALVGYVSEVKARKDAADARGGTYSDEDWAWLRGQAESVNAEIQKL
jgi:hypothetical protein